MYKRVLFFMSFSFVFGCSQQKKSEKGDTNKLQVKDTIDRDAIIQGLENGDLFVEHLDAKGRVIDFKFDDTVNLKISYHSKYPTLNKSYKLFVKPLSDNLRVKNKGGNQFTLLIDTSKNVNEAKYEIRMHSDNCLFKSYYPKVHYSSDMELSYRVYKR